MKYVCPECGKEITFNEETMCYHCECGYFEAYEVVEGIVEHYSIGTPLESIIRGQTLDNDYDF